MITLIATALLATGCSAGPTSEGNPGSTPAVSDSGTAPALGTGTAAAAGAVDLLRTGTAFIDHTSFRADVDIAGGQVTTEAHVDNADKRADATVSASGTATEIRMIDNDIYMKTSAKLPGVGDGWLILDPAKVPAGFVMSFAPGMNDPGGSARLINAIVSAQVSGVEVTGTIDLTKVGTGNGISFRPPPSGNFPDSARNQQFHATLDNQGRLVGFVIPASNAGPSATLRYSEFGAAVTVSPPQGAVPAPDALYPQLGLH
jgi:hypothetical protein